ITSNCHIQTAFPPNRLETAEHLSKLTGTTTIIKEQVTRSGRGFLGTQVSTTMQEVQRPLLTPDECQRMPGPQKDEHDRIAPASRRSTAGSLFILRMKRSRPARRYRRQSTVSHFLVCQRRRSKFLSLVLLGDENAGMCF